MNYILYCSKSLRVSKYRNCFNNLCYQLPQNVTRTYKIRRVLGISLGITCQWVKVGLSYLLSKAELVLLTLRKVSYPLYFTFRNSAWQGKFGQSIKTIVRQLLFSGPSAFWYESLILSAVVQLYKRNDFLSQETILSFLPISQVFPPSPEGHEHSKWPGRLGSSPHFPPFLHGFEWHGLLAKKKKKLNFAGYTNTVSTTLLL